LHTLDTPWIWQHDAWPDFTWDEHQLSPSLRHLHYQLGVLVGASLPDQSREQQLDALLQNLLCSSAIEGESLNAQSVRSSLAKRLGLHSDTPYPTSLRSEGLAQMMMDAITQLDHPLTINQLFQWHTWLFPEQDVWTGRIRVGALRGDEPMQVVSWRIDRPTVHFEAPPRVNLEQRVQQFVDWFNNSAHQQHLDPLVRAAITHLWFVTLHPFDDGNGRITRALTDRALAQGDSHSIRLYAMSVAILDHRQGYYDILEHTQRGGLDITHWLVWFCQILTTTIDTALAQVQHTLQKTRFWRQHNLTELLPEQKKVLNRLLDGDFAEGINASKYQAVARVSKPTATRHLSDLVEKGCLKKQEGGGRNTRYALNHANAI
jgi:Fic family protein